MTFTRCHLHVPHKNWSGDDEKLNYITIERWQWEFYRRFLLFQDYRAETLLIPRKDWSGSIKERENYLEIERWATIMLPQAVGQVIFGDTRLDLHIPHKDWAIEEGRDNGPLELENNLAIERWARGFIRGCLPGGNA